MGNQLQQFFTSFNYDSTSSNSLQRYDQSFQDLVNLDLFFEPNCGELDVIVDDVEFDSLTEDPEVLLCNHYGINYDQVNCIELYES